MVVKWLGRVLDQIVEAWAAAWTHAIGLAGVGAIVVGVWGLLGWPAAAIAAGLPFAGFWVWGQALRVIVDYRNARGGA